MSAPAEPTLQDALTFLGVTAFVVVLWFATLGSRPLFNPDEGRYAEIPREMLSGGDWIIPHLNGLAYIEKPPLQYWATALSLKALGPTEFASRFYTAACSVLAIALVWLTAARLWSAAAAWRGLAMLGSMLLFVVMGHLLTLDMSLTFFTTLSLAGFLLAQPSARSSGSKGWMMVAWAAAALGVLTKGLVAALIPAAVLMLYTLVSRDVSPWRRLEVVKGSCLFLIIAAPWHWLAAQRQPEFLQFFFVHEHFARYLTPSADRMEPWWYFGVVFLLGSLPWTLTAVRTLGSGWRRAQNRGHFNPETFLRIWVIFVIIFFSLSDSKLIPYVLPALPALALLMAASPRRSFRREVTITAIFTLLIAVVLGCVSWEAPRLLASNDRREYFILLVRPLAEVAALLAASAAFVLVQRRRGTTHAAVFLSAGWCISAILLMRAAGLVAPLYSGIELARAGLSIPRDTPIYSVGTYDQTLPFYWRRPVTLAAYRGELDFGLRQDPAAEIPDVADFLEQWNTAPAAYAVMEKSLFTELSKRSIPMRILAQDGHRLLVSRR